MICFPARDYDACPNLPIAAQTMIAVYVAACKILPVNPTIDVFPSTFLRRNMKKALLWNIVILVFP